MFKKHGGKLTMETIGLNDKINFNCNKCGTCCMGNSVHMLMLNPIDVILLARHANKSTMNYLLQDTFLDTIQIEGNLEKQYIIVRLKYENDKCIYYKNNRCSIYEIRPTICRTYPLAIRNINPLQTKNPIDFICNTNGLCKNIEIDGSGILVKDFINYEDLESTLEVLNYFEYLHARTEAIFNNLESKEHKKILRTLYFTCLYVECPPYQNIDSFLMEEYKMYSQLLMEIEKDSKNLEHIDKQARG